MILSTVLLFTISSFCYAQDDSTPKGLLISPVPRNFTPRNVTDLHPCSGMSKGFSHLLAEPGSLNPISWKIDTPDKSGTCQVRISDSSDFGTFTTLFPTDGSANDEGVFPCGREKIYYETKDVVFPDFNCDECTLQWMWNTSAGTFYQCADV